MSQYVITCHAELSVMLNEVKHLFNRFFARFFAPLRMTKIV